MHAFKFSWGACQYAVQAQLRLEKKIPRLWFKLRLIVLHVINLCIYSCKEIPIMFIGPIVFKAPKVGRYKTKDWKRWLVYHLCDFLAAAAPLHHPDWQSAYRTIRVINHHHQYLCYFLCSFPVFVVLAASHPEESLDSPTEEGMCTTPQPSQHRSIIEFNVLRFYWKA